MNLATQKRKNVETAELTADGRYKRKVRSFTLRTGRFSEFQRTMMNQYWQDFGLDFKKQPFDFHQIFGNNRPIILEIGFGMGKSLIEMAKANPDKNYLGIEVHTPGVGACIASAVEQKITNLRIVCHDAVEVLKEAISDKSLSGVQLFFPDPWHKARHHKRRIVQAPFVALLGQKLKQGGFVHFATDWQNYAEHMLETLQNASNLQNNAPDGAYFPRPDFRPLTKFEERGQRLGHGVWDLYFTKI